MAFLLRTYYLYLDVFRSTGLITLYLFTPAY
jgi:hypothetical protein